MSIPARHTGSPPSTFARKLWRELAFGISIALMVTWSACKTETVDGLSPLPITPPVTGPSQLRPISGDSQKAPIGATLPQPLVARALDSTGTPFPGLAITWAASKGELRQVQTVTDGTGSASAQWTFDSTVGTKTVVVSGAGIGSITFTGTAFVQLEQITIAPGSVSLTPGSTQDFNVVGRYSDGTTKAPPVTFTATGGVITSAGLYTAGGSTGSFIVVATSGKLADTATVSIRIPIATLQSITLAPSSASITTGQTKQFSVSGVMSDGTTITPAVNFSATGGTISTGGLYKAGTSAGTFRVIATQQAGTLADTSVVTVAASTPTLTSIVVSPTSVLMAPGDSQHFSATGFLSNGGSTPVTVTYTATGGTVTSAGLYRSGASLGNFTVTATQQGGALSGAAQIAVTGPGSYPAPDIFSWSFEDGTAGVLEPFSHAADIFSDDAAVIGQSHSAGKSFPTGSGATSYGWLFHPSATYDEVWVRFGMWQQGIYQGTGATGQKIMRLYASVGGNDAYTASFGQDGGGGWLWDFGAWDNPNRSNRNVTVPAPGKNNGWNFGVWHWLEWHYTNRVGEKATIEIYFDGEPTPRFRATSDYTVTSKVGRYFEIYSTINGPFTGPLSYKFDDIAYSTQRIGLPPGAKVGIP